MNSTEVFTSFRLEDGEAWFFQRHAHRLMNSCSLLFGRSKGRQIMAAIKQKMALDPPLPQANYGRIEVLHQGPWQGGEGQAHWSWEERSLPAVPLLAAAVPRQGQRWAPSTVKTADYTEARWQLRHLTAPLADVLWLDGRGQVLEFTTSNVAALIEGQWVFPAFGKNAYDGLMREAFHQFLREVRTEVRIEGPPKSSSSAPSFRPLPVEALKQAEMVVATNCVRGLIWCQRVDDKEWANEQTFFQLKRDFDTFLQKLKEPLIWPTL